MSSEQMNMIEKTVEVAFKGIGVIILGLLGYFATKTFNNIDQSVLEIRRELENVNKNMDTKMDDMNLNIRMLEKKVDRMEIYYEIKEGKNK
jgi:hypothetical protein